MIIGSVSENKEIEKRISITPELAKKFIINGFKIIVEKDYGKHIGFSDEMFLKEDVNEAAKTILADRKHLDNNPKLITEKNLIDILKKFKRN